MTVKDLLEQVAHQQVEGNIELEISKIKAFEATNLERKALMWVNEKNVVHLNNQTLGILICPNTVQGNFSKDLTLIFSKHPRRTFKEALNVLYGAKKKEYGVATTASIHESVALPTSIFIGHNVVIEENCILGEGIRIGHNTVIHANTVIKKQVSIGSNCTIGGVGFGYEKNELGIFEQILHIGNVEIEEQVEIGNNTCIDRAVLGSTKIGKYVKIDNLVHISHGVQIKENALIIANSMIAGSVNIGKNTWVAPSSAILNKVSIGDDVTIGLGAIVIRNVPDGEVVVGNPAKSIKKKNS